MGTCIAIGSSRRQVPPECASSIGREREIAELESLLLGPQTGPIPVVIVHGRRGIGKTTLAAALAQRACAHRVDVIWAAESSLLEVPPESVVILDDACEAAPGKLERLAQLLGDGSVARVLLLCRGTRHRVAPQLADWLDRFQTEPGCRFLMLRALQTKAAEALARAACGTRAPADAVAATARRTAGDPSLIREFARVVRDDPASAVDPAVPETVAGVVSLRLATLGEQQQRVVQLASLFAGAFAVEWLAPLAELSESEVFAALRSAEDSGLVEQKGDDRFEISAPVARDAMRSLAFGGRLQRAHRRLAEALLALPAEAGAAPAEIARQYHSSRQLPGADRGVEPALQAAGQALAARSPLRAAELLELALELCPIDQLAVQARLTGALARAWASALCHAEAAAALERACQALRASGAAGAQVAELVIDVSRALPLALACIDAPACERIRALVGPLDEALGKQLESALNPQRSQVIGASSLRARVVRIAGAGDSPGHTAAVFRAAAETIEVLLDRAITRPLLLLAREQAEALGSSAAHSLLYAVRAVEAARGGDVIGAAELAQAGVNAGAALNGRRREPPLVPLIQLLTLAHIDPDWERLSASARRLAAEHWHSPLTVSLTAFAALANARAGDAEGSRASLRQVIVELEASPEDVRIASSALGTAAEAAWRLNESELGERLLPITRRVLDAGGGDFYMSQRDLTVARLSLLTGDRDAAEAAYRRALAALGDAGERTLSKLAAHEYEQAPASGEGQVSYGPDGLTRRQVEVLLLLSEGLTNRQIADRLVLSVNTVNRHVADIYRKVGAQNRVAAAAYVARNGLT